MKPFFLYISMLLYFLSIMYQVGVIKYYDRGIGEGAILRKTVIKPNTFSASHNNRFSPGDIVIYRRENNSIVEVKGINEALEMGRITIPWDDILIQEDFIINKGDWIHTPLAIKSLLNTDDDTISKFPIHLDANHLESFCSTFFSKEFFDKQINEENLEKYKNLLKSIFDNSLKINAFGIISSIFTIFLNLDNYYLIQLINHCNDLVSNSPQSLLGHIRNLKCFQYLAKNLPSQEITINFRLEVYLARAIIENNFSFVPNLPPIDPFELKRWLYDGLNDDDFSALANFFKSDNADDTFKRVYIESLSPDLIRERLDLYPYFSEELKLKFLDQLTKDLRGYVNDNESREMIVSVLGEDPFFHVHRYLILPNPELSAAFTIREANYAVFDLEAFEKDGLFEIKQAAFVSGTKTVSYPEQVNSLASFFDMLSSYDIIIGHNIKKWDIRVLNNNNFFFKPSSFIWDTLEIEMLLNPFSAGYSLYNPEEERHTAKSDAEFTKKLFWDQMIRLSGELDNNGGMKDIFPPVILSLFEVINSIKDRSVFDSLVGNQPFFRQFGNIVRSFSLDLSGIKENDIVIAPKSLWRIIREYSDVLFDDDDISFKSLDRDSLSKVNVTDIKTAILYALSHSKKKDILVCDLSPAVRRFLSDSLPAYYLKSVPEHSPLCCTSWKFDTLDAQRKDKARSIFIVGKEIEARENNNESECVELDHSTLISSPDGRRLLRKFSESNTPNRISQEIYQTLSNTGLPRNCGNIWVEELSDERFRIKYNRDFGKYASDLENTYEGKVRIISFKYNLSNAPIRPIQIIRTNHGPIKEDVSFNNPEPVQRLSSTTKSRCSYWAYQFSLIISMERTMPVVWVVEKLGEIEQLKIAAREMGFYVPSSGNVLRDIELANERTKPESALVIIGDNDLWKLIDAEIQEEFCLVYNCIDIESKSIRWNGLLPFGDEPMKLSDNPTLDDYVYASWPQLEIINYLIHRNNPNCLLCMLDPIFDCCVLNYSKLHACSVPVMIEDTTYSSCKKSIESLSDPESQHFEVNDMAEAMNEMLMMFKEINPNVKDWKDEQREVLPKIIQKKDNCLICMPTGGGKSILFQIPALYRSKHSGKMSIVISPLKALLKDQVVDLDMPGVDYLNSDRSADEVERIYQKIRGGEIQLLYMTPERFRSRSFMNALGYRLKKDNGLEYIIFDEAHCISQWGLDFRPDYRYAAEVSESICEAFKEIKIELFTATVTKNVREDISAIIPDLDKNESNHERYNPVRDHINIGFVRVDDDPNAKGNKEDLLSPREKKRVKLIYDEIEQSDFDPARSTMLIFSSTRRQVEVFKTELAKKFAKSEVERIRDLADQIECFHGGMTTDEREEIYRKFKKTDENDSREFSILVATKAFGMGMNIPDIHYVYHAFPPENIEDYLQEIGRAGREEKYFPNGYGSRKCNRIPLPTKCFVSDEDARHLKDLQSRNSLKWNEVRGIYDAVSNYISEFSKDGLMYVSVPSNVWKRQTEYGLKDDPTAFKIGLYWLSEAGRVETRYLSTAAYDFVIGKKFDDATVGREKKLHDYIQKQHSGPLTAGTKIQIKVSDLRRYCDVRQREVDDLVLSCHSKSIVELANEVSFIFSNRYKKNPSIKESFTGKEPKKRENYPEEYSVPFMACKAMLEKLNGDALELDIVTRNKCISNVLEGTQFSVRINQMSSKERKDSARKNEEFRINTIVYKLIKLLPSVKSIREDTDSKKWHIDSKPNNILIEELEALSSDGFEFLRYLTNLSYKPENSDNKAQNVRQNNSLPTFIWTKVAIALGFDFLRISNAAEIIRIIGFATIDSFLPTGTEIKLTKNREALISDTLDSDAIDQHPDRNVYIRFKQIDDIRGLKLVNLMTLAKIKGNGEKPDSLWERYDLAIKDYFECAKTEDFLNWNNRIIDKDKDNAWLSPTDEEMIKEMISQYQGKALNEQLKALNQDQKKIVNEDKDKDIVVLAGPGSGKTHVLTLRCAKLLHSDKVNKEDLLVLAYNRGIVIELKTRLKSLFLSLGYTNMMSRIKVMTFHSFIKTMDVMLKEYRASSSHADISKVSGFISDTTQNWEKDFCEFLQNKNNVDEFRSMLDAKLFHAVYFMIDEFQDVTKERLEVLFAMRRILPTIPGHKEPHFFVIGDINQSIYGYQRTIKDNFGNSVWSNDISISPVPYYKKLRDELRLSKDNDLTMGINYRSFQEILCKAEEVLKTCSQYEKVDIKSNRKNQGDKCVFEIDAEASSWDSDFANIINDLRERGLKQAAFLFRTNLELYAAYTKYLSKQNGNPELTKGLRIRIQGDSEPFFRTRECYFAILYLKQQEPKKIIDEEGFMEFLKYIADEKHIKYLDKEAIDLTFAIALSCFESMQQNPTYGDLADEMMDVAYEKASDLQKIKDYYKDNYKEQSYQFEKQGEIDIVFSVMHRVKGLQFDAVIINPSENNIGLEKIKVKSSSQWTWDDVQFPEHALKDALDEERRLLYVSITRAKKYLRIYWGARERRLLSGENKAYKSNVNEGDSVRINSGLRFYNKSFSLKDSVNKDYEISKNTPIVIKKQYYGDGAVCINNNIIGSIYKDVDNGKTKVLPDQNSWSSISGLYLNDLYVWRFEDACNVDKKHEGEKNWISLAEIWKKKTSNPNPKPYDYVLIPDVSGIGQIINER